MSGASSARIPTAYAAIAAGRPEVFIEVVPQPEAAAEHSDRVAAGGSLAGLLLAVKNNVDVAGFATTAACPAFADGPAREDASAVARLRAAGATVVGVTNLDQFATGLVGQRSPYGGVRDSRRPDFVSGGSSSGSAVAVALGMADIAIGTDTAGSGRVPAAFQGIVGIKPTLGTVSTSGVVPACRSWDAVTILARDLDTANTAMGAMAGGADTRTWPADIPLAAPTAARVAVPDDLSSLAPGWADAFTAAADRLQAQGCTVDAIPFADFLAAARLLYDGALVAERHAAVGAFIEAHRDDPAVDPTVSAIIGAAAAHTGSTMTQDLERLAVLEARASALWAGRDALLIPTAPGHPTRAAVAADPVGVNAWVGTFTNFCNLFDLCAVAVPAGCVTEPDGSLAQFGVTVVARPFHDAVALDLAQRVMVAPPDLRDLAGPTAAPALPPADPWPVRAGAPAVDLFVVGAHLVGQPLEHELRRLGARWVGTAATTASYRLAVLATSPPKPGLARVADSSGAEIPGEVWQLSTGALGRFLAELPAPMMLGPVDLADGRTVVGFGCTTDAVGGATDITGYGDWRSYLAAMTRPDTGNGSGMDRNPGRVQRRSDGSFFSK
ncbi:allophanate hydrolase [Nocardioides immobilis]|uniref:Allophanate hydrolase n=1 Tax=Nocardioides immobilis TaxID=2049295 RepID=A0A417XSF7_9ACTN|nr:allophanate hydrolase [Nocardioides immobilis]RHW23260.1 allophanate hydrolase [Nocardioides immobilis]